ncbi:unnamed protein product [Rhodiola kirilowii]
MRCHPLRAGSSHEEMLILLNFSWANGCTPGIRSDLRGDAAGIGKLNLYKLLVLQVIISWIHEPIN